MTAGARNWIEAPRSGFLIERDLRVCRQGKWLATFRIMSAPHAGDTDMPDAIRRHARVTGMGDPDRSPVADAGDTDWSFASAPIVTRPCSACSL